MTVRELPAPHLGFTFPSVGALLYWAGRPTEPPLSENELCALRQDWRTEMESRGYVLAWVDPATGKIASRT